MVTQDGHDFHVYYAAETSIGVMADDQTWTPLLEVENISGRGKSQEVIETFRHGKRQRQGAVYSKIDQDDLQFTVNLTDDAMAGDTYTTFLVGFDEAFDASPVSYVFLIMDSNDASGSLYEYYHGAYLNEVEISASDEQIISVTLTFLIQQLIESATELYVSVSNTYTAYPATIAYLLASDIAAFAKSGTFTSATNFLTDGTLMEFSLTLSQNGEKLWRIDGQKYPNKVHFGEYDVEGSMVVDYENLLQMGEITAETAGILTLDLGLTTAATIALTNVTFESVTYDSEPNSLITQDIDFSADEATIT